MMCAGTCSLLKPVSGSIAYLSPESAPGAESLYRQLSLPEARRVYEPPEFSIELRSIPYSTGLYFPVVVPGHVIRCLREDQAHVLAVGSMFAVVGDWIYCRCYGYERGGSLDFARAGVLKMPKIVYGGKLSDDSGEETRDNEVESICESIAPEKFWSAELLFPSDFPDEIIGWWDVSSSASFHSPAYRA